MRGLKSVAAPGILQGVLKTVCLISRTFLVVLVCCASVRAANSEPAAVSVRSQSAPRARVAIAEDLGSISTFNPDAGRVEQLLNRSLLIFTGKATREMAWRGLVSSNDIVGVKVVSGPGGSSGTRPSVVAAIVKGLIDSGHPRQKIVIWDKHRTDLARAGYVELARRLGVEVISSFEEGYDDDAFYDTALLGKLVWGDHDFGKNTDTTGRRSYVSRLITKRLTKIVNVTPLLNHNLAGVSGNLHTLAMDSVDNTIRFESSPEHLAQAVPEIYALEALGDKVVLNVVDALICQYQGEERSLLHYSTMLGQIRISTDPVALDTLSIDEIESQRLTHKIEAPKPNMKIYTNAHLLELGVGKTNHIDIIRSP